MPIEPKLLNWQNFTLVAFVMIVVVLLSHFVLTWASNKEGT